MDDLESINNNNEIEKVDRVKKVEHLHKSFILPVGEVPKLIPEDRSKLRFDLIQEELNEYKDAVQNKDLTGISDAIIDMLYVVYGTAVEHGLHDLVDDMFEEVQRSNMSKLGEDGKPILRDDGKFLKGPNYFKPDLAKFLQDDNVKYE